MRLVYLFSASLSCCIIAVTAHLDSDLLSWSPHVAVFNNFLSHEECDKLIDHTKTQKSYNATANGDISVYFDQYPRLPSWIQDIERRISSVTGQAPHPNEESINIHQIKQVDQTINKDFDDVRQCLQSEERNPLSCQLSVQNIHHDKVQKEYSSVTMIVYLNDVEVSGGTVFPCMATYTKNNSIVDPMICGDAFNNGARWFDGDMSVMLGTYNKHRPPKKLRESLVEILLTAHIGCLHVNDRPTSRHFFPVSTVATKGSAIVFHHNRPDGFPETNAWHGGCRPLSGDKWTLQKFKEWPSSYRMAGEGISKQCGAPL